MPTFRGAYFEIEDVDGDFKRLFADKQLAKQVKSFLGTVVLLTTSKLEDRIKAEAPEDTGDLKRAIGIWTSRSGLTGKAGVVADDPEQAHAGLANEYGTKHMNKIRPFMVPAAEQETPKFVTRCEEALQQVERLLSKGW
jgi:hypothetical protein